MMARRRLRCALLASVLTMLTDTAQAIQAVSVEIAGGNKTEILRLSAHFPPLYDFNVGKNKHIVMSWTVDAAYWKLNNPPDVVGATNSLYDIGIAPVFRLISRERTNWYIEAGVGLHALSHLYRNNDRELATSLQFLTGVGVGYEFRGGIDVNLNVQHMSNGGVKHPNQGVNFLALRLMQRF